MAVTQYIGARYVPVFADPAEWVSTRTYEPLTIVTHEGNSYTSRQYVPAGIDITNTAYWVETGDYNAQVEAYRKEVTDYKKETDAAVSQVSQNLTKEETERKAEDTTLGNSITQLASDTKEKTDALTSTDTALAKDISTNATRIEHVYQEIEHKKTYSKMIYLGDSWGRGYYQNADHLDEGIASQIASNLGATLVNKSVGGAGMFAGTNFLQQWNSLTDDEKNGTDLIVICGGQNDIEQSVTDVETNAHSLFDALATYEAENLGVRVVYLPYPLTKYRTFVPIGSETTIDVPDGVKSFITLPNYARMAGIATASGCYRWCSTFSDAATDDAYHLNAAGYKGFAREATEFIVGGSDFYPHNWDQLQVPSGTVFKNYRNNQVYEINGIVTIRFAAEADEEMAPGKVLATIPGNICPGHTFYYEAGLREGCFLSFDTTQTNGVTSTSIAVQGASILQNDWVFINLAYPAAL